MVKEIRERSGKIKLPHKTHAWLEPCLTACNFHCLRTGFSGWLEDPQVGSEFVPFQVFALLYQIIGTESIEVRLCLFLL